MWKKEMVERFPNITIKINEPLSRYTYTKTGGNAEVIVFPKKKEDIIDLIEFSKENIPLTILGNGSNVIIKDTGISGIVLILTEMMGYEITGEEVSVFSGMKLIDLAKIIRNHELTGFEFACGIPGSVGGAIYMNAGAYGGQMQDIVKSVEVITKKGEYKIYSNQDMDFSYRHSIIQETNDIVIRTTFQLKNGNYDDINSKMLELTHLRESKQPLEYPSCGSVFKRPTGYFTGKLIQDANLQGYRIGGVEVSKKHAGFMVNIDHGTAKDYEQLINHVKKVIKEKYDIELETEVKFIGD